MPLSLINEQGEVVPFPPEGITVRELVESFGGCRLALLTDAVSQDQSSAAPESAAINREELNGLIAEPAVGDYSLIERASYSSILTSVTAKLAAGTATARLRVGASVLGSYQITTAQNVWALDMTLLADARLVLEITAATSAEGLAFTIGFTR